MWDVTWSGAVPPYHRRAEILLASNANIGNPATAATLAAARGCVWSVRGWEPWLRQMPAYA